MTWQSCSRVRRSPGEHAMAVPAVPPVKNENSMVDEPKYNGERLPAWFARPEPFDVWQTSLFAEQLDDVLAALRVNPDELARWSDRGWVSFGPELSDRLEQPHV